MAFVVDVSTFVDVVTKVYSLQQQLRIGLYKSSQELVSFGALATKLQENNKHWESLLRKYGMEEVGYVQVPLDEAHRLLVETEKQVERLQQNCCLRIHKVAFPGELTVAIEMVTKAFENLPVVLEARRQEVREVEIAASEAALHEASKLPFFTDKKYIPIQKTMEKLQNFLESETTGQVVALYGGPGEGKSSAARHLALHYQDSPTYFTDGVFFLICGPKADCRSLLVQLSKDLGYPDLCTPIDEDNREMESMPNGHPFRKLDLMKQLSYRLKGKKLLIVLDDVYNMGERENKSLIENLLVKGSHIKYLVTTQKKGLNCVDVDIRIDVPNLGEAFKIIARHVEFANDEVPSNLKDIVEVIVDQVDNNPLALANVAMSIRKDRNEELGEWKSTKDYIDELPYDDKRLDNSMKMALDSFPQETVSLLCMAGVFDFNQPVPEVVLKIFCKSINKSLARFSRCSEDLENTSFIRVEIQDSEWSSKFEPQRTWSIHDMRQKFISKNKSEEVKQMMDKLFGEDSMSTNEREAPILETIQSPRTIKVDCDNVLHLVYALLIIYGQIPWKTRAASRLGISTTNGDNGYSTAHAVKYFCWLLTADFLDGTNKSSKEDWERNAHELAVQVDGNVQFWAAYALTVLDPTKGDKTVLQSSKAYEGRGRAKLILGMYEAALGDFCIGLDMDPKNQSILCDRVLTKVKLEDYGGALDDANRAVELDPQNPLTWQERGVLRRMMQDFEGALVDLDKSLELGPNDYEVLKHRGLVKFLIGNEGGARVDGEMANKQKSFATSYEEAYSCLGTLPVKYLDFEL